MVIAQGQLKEETTETNIRKASISTPSELMTTESWKGISLIYLMHVLIFTRNKTRFFTTIVVDDHCMFRVQYENFSKNELLVTNASALVRKKKQLLDVLKVA